MTTMTLETVAGCLRECIAADVAAFIWGKPGIGKSDMVRQVAAAEGMALIDFRASLRDTVDLRGLPLVDAKSGTTRWLAPDELPNEKRDGKRGILFLDELNTAAQSMQTGCFGLVLDRQLGEYKLPRGWVPIAAGNRMTDRAAAQRMPTALRNRFAHFEVDADLGAWVAWASGAANVNPAVVAFIRFRPELLHVMPSGDDNAFPTPRAWERVARFADKPESIRQHLVASLVGDGAAAEFEGFMRVWKSLPSIAQILSDPQGVRVPTMEEPAALYAVSAALARRVDRNTFGKALDYAKRMPKEFSILLAVDAVKRDPALKNTEAFGLWAVANQDVTL